MITMHDDSYNAGMYNYNNSKHSDRVTKFYKTSAWHKCRLAYMQSVSYVCERCSDVAKIVHHKIYIDDSNVDDVNVTLNHDNLEALCHTCHNQEHFKTDSATDNRVTFNIYGEVVEIK